MHRNILVITEDIIKLLSKEKELSIRQISLKLKSQWRTAKKALDTIETLGIVKVRDNDKTDRVEKLYSLGDN
jgi:predicted transcriptional regulator